jgi:hypothetical protein
MLGTSRLVLDTRLIVPDVEGFRPDHAVDGGWHLASVWMEVAIDECMSREKALRLIRRFEALHLSLSPPRRSV